MLNTCLFPVAGFGTRFLPVTKSIPKEMLPIVDKPLILYAVLEAIEAGILNMGLITSKHKKAIEDFFDYNPEVYSQVKNTPKEQLLDEVFFAINNANFIYTRQKEIKGLGDAILCGEPLTNGAAAVILPDDLCVNENGDSVLTQMLKIYNKYKCSVVAVEEIEIKNSTKYGIIDGAEIESNIFQISNMIEKPEPKDAPTNLAIIGRYILTQDIFDIIKTTQPGKGGEVQITDALMTLAKNSQVLAYKFEGKRFDCGSAQGFVEATNYFYNKNY
jgi:UTP--glucose-1-phosphate uridylyltransferase